MFNNGQWIAPNLFLLESRWATPITLQLALLLVSFPIGCLCLKCSPPIKCVAAYLFIAACTAGSWYSVTLSNATNELSFGFKPIWEARVPFDQIKVISHIDNRIEARTKTETVNVPLGIYPFGLERTSILEALSAYGDCINATESHCREWAFSWP